MKTVGVVVHHSVCPSINGKGYDFFIMKNGIIIPSSVQTEPGYVHICLEGDFAGMAGAELGSPERKEQLFLFQKLVIRLSRTLGFPLDHIQSHTESCPGKGFPWAELVISVQDGYH
ncbi:hypothetical protein [Gorillibacterium sp. sgz5001074]|uniref:hypothetical protein n=1 Tax=Gorillibacterium sp. sgz5001074 TaxID=3446695 RepID=UPI003F679F14